MINYVRKKPRKMLLAHIDPLFQILSKANPNPKTELDFISPYTLLVAVVLSAQATDVSVNKATKTLFQKAATPESMVKLGITKIKKHIKTIGLYNTKANNIFKLSKILIDNHNSLVPSDRQSLEALPGVGRKTANVVMNEAFGKATIAVDTHIFRVGNRTGLAPGKTPSDVEHQPLRRVPDKWKKGAHHWLILHGRYICKARNPDCNVCLISDFCCYNSKNIGKKL